MGHSCVVPAFESVPVRLIALFVRIFPGTKASCCRHDHGGRSIRVVPEMTLTRSSFPVFRQPQAARSGTGPGPVPGSVRVLLRWLIKSIWDHGIDTDVRTTEDKLVIDLVGERLNDRFAIFRTGGPNWIAHMMIER